MPSSIVRGTANRPAVEEARRLLREGRRAEAIRLYEEHLEADDDDDEARLEYGIACLVNGDRERFLEVGMEYRPCMSATTLRRLGSRVQALWAVYAEPLARLAARAAVGASVIVACGAAGCSGKPAAEGTGKPEAAETAAPEQATAAPPPVPAEVEDAGAPLVAEPPDAGDAVPDTPGQTSSVKPVPKPKDKPKDKPVIIKTRYVAVHFDDDDPF